ncbi:MAG: retropepsin-like aspartic protease [Fimbriiglobus sp.]
MSKIVAIFMFYVSILAPLQAAGTEGNSIPILRSQETSKIYIEISIAKTRCLFLIDTDSPSTLVNRSVMMTNDISTRRASELQQQAVSKHTTSQVSSATLPKMVVGGRIFRDVHCLTSDWIGYPSDESPVKNYDVPCLGILGQDWLQDWKAQICLKTNRLIIPPQRLASPAWSVLAITDGTGKQLHDPKELQFLAFEFDPCSMVYPETLKSSVRRKALLATLDNSSNKCSFYLLPGEPTQYMPKSQSGYLQYEYGDVISKIALFRMADSRSNDQLLHNSMAKNLQLHPDAFVYHLVPKPADIGMARATKRVSRARFASWEMMRILASQSYFLHGQHWHLGQDGALQVIDHRKQAVQRFWLDGEMEIRTVFTRGLKPHRAN